jgi:nucleoside-diphosphate-sugar epimerase
VTAVLVSGASGFIGRAACAEFARRGWRVVPGSRASGSLEHGWPMQDVGVVVHLAGIAHELGGQNAEALYLELNCRATERIARAAARAGVRRFVFMSSIKVNGERTPIDRPFRADDAPAPQDRYARSKWEAERALARVAADTGLEVVVLRPPLVYGPGVRANFLRLLRLVDRCLPLPFGAIRNRRSLVYLGNLVDLIVLAASSPRAAGRTLLVADGADLSTPQLINEIGRALGVKPRLFSIPAPLLRLAGAATGRRPEIERLVESLAVDIAETRAALGWQPPQAPSEGFAHTARWYRSLGGAR